MTIENVNRRENFSMSVTLQGREANLTFNLDEKSEVRVMIADLNVFNVKEILKNKTYEAGKHSISYNIGKPGIYSVALVVNGGVFEKKIKVE